MLRKTKVFLLLYMENAIVTFKDRDTENFITVTLQYNKEESTLDYDLKFSDNYSQNSKTDFVGFLAKMFLETLQIKDND